MGSPRALASAAAASRPPQSFVKAGGQVKEKPLSHISLRDRALRDKAGMQYSERVFK